MIIGSINYLYSILMCYYFELLNFFLNNFDKGTSNDYAIKNISD